jgi:uracil phosphoribosyltransferase
MLAAQVILVPVLRAGLAMLFAMLDFLPGSQVGMLGLERDETTAIAHAYYEKQPSTYSGAKTILLDPMLATGGSALAALERLKARGAQDIRIACIVSCPEGLTAVRTKHPDVLIYTCAIDRQLNAQAYILPGLGDFGDRYFGTP